jgi:hypothetical protein
MADTETTGTGATESARREVTTAELLAIQPGLARLMPEIGDRFWKCYYAAQAGNWPLASWQMREMRKLFRLGTFTRPKYSEDLDAYMNTMLGPVTDALRQEDFAGFDRAFHAAVDSANEYHGRWNKGYIIWRLPGAPPQDLDLTPRPRAT